MISIFWWEQWILKKPKTNINPQNKYRQNRQAAWAAVYDNITNVQVLLTVIDYPLPTDTEKYTKAMLFSLTSSHVWFP